MIVKTDPADLFYLVEQEPALFVGAQSVCAMTEDERKEAAEAKKNPIGFIWESNNG